MVNIGASNDAWRKSSRCESHSCVEVALGSTSAAIRNTDRREDQLSFTAPAWQQFIDGIRSGHLSRH